MSKPFTFIAGLVFLLAGAAQAFRAYTGSVSVTIAGHPLPIWVSWPAAGIAFVFAFFLIFGTRTKRRGTLMTHTGKCFCGAVTLEVSGDPEGMGYCHCSSCRSWSGGPVNAFSLWKPEAVRVTSGADNIATYQKTEKSQRQYCKKCGGHLMTRHPLWGLVDVFTATIPTLDFKPGVHVNYAETVLPMKDGLPKLKDFPAELGGSGEAVPE